MKRVTIATALLALPLAVGALAAQATWPAMPDDDRVRLAEAFRLSAAVGERVWPGWNAVAMPVLLVRDSVEYLVAHPAPTPDFTSLGHDPLLGRPVLARARRFPAGFLATFPAVGGVPTIVVGTAARTRKSSAEWVVTLLHEHFHQMQYARPSYQRDIAALDLARGDTTGMWMLEYPFPYDSGTVAAAVRRLTETLLADGATLDAARAAYRDVVATLDASDRRYLEFQLWQEGVSRWVEYAAARAAASSAPPAPAFRALPDYEPYAALAERQRSDLRAELEGLTLPGYRRVAFYPLGAAMVLRVDGVDGGWKRRYVEQPLRFAPILRP